MEDNLDTLVPLGEVSSLLPLQKAKKIHRSTFHRWRSRGISGVSLDCIRIGGGWYTSKRKVDEFLSRLQKKGTWSSST